MRTADLGLEAFDPAEAEALLVELGVTKEDRDDVLATLPDPYRTPERWKALEHEVSRLLGAMGRPDLPHAFPDHAGAAAKEERCFFVHVFLATWPRTREFMRGLGVPEGVARDTGTDLARHMEIHRRVHGSTGVDNAWWVTLVLRGEIFELGRLQFNWFQLGVGDESPRWYDEATAKLMGPGFQHGDFCIGVHIPESGPLTPEACDESFRRAGRLFLSGEEFRPPPGLAPPTAQGRVLATCLSWLLDDQLADWLPGDSNIVRFQKRFKLVPPYGNGDRHVLQFVFRTTAHDLKDLDALPQRTTLERAAVEHIRRGNHWRERTGWLELKASPTAPF